MQTKDVFLHPGELHFERIGGRIRTLLGSCVAIAFWHPRQRIGGMCHFLLPARARAPAMPFDGKYADEAMTLLASAMRAAGTEPKEYEARLYGGGNMFPQNTRPQRESVGNKNATAAKKLVLEYGMATREESLGGTGHRNVSFDVASGKVRMEHQDLGPELQQCQHCENKTACYG